MTKEQTIVTWIQLVKKKNFQSCSILKTEGKHNKVWNLLIKSAKIIETSRVIVLNNGQIG